MIWLTWRQHRAEALTLGLLVAVVGAVLLTLGLPMHDLFPVGAEHCALPPLGPSCRLGVVRLQQSSVYSGPLLTLLNLVPFAIGGFLGAPLLARELESATWQLAWTQAVPRMRWLTVKLVSLGALTVTLTTAFSALTTWYREPLNLFGRFEISGFDVSGLVPPAYALFAFAVSVAAGVLLRRSLPALAAALAAFVVVRATVAAGLRPNYRAPVTLDEVVPAGAREVHFVTRPQDWTLGEGLSDASGRHLDLVESSRLEHLAQDAATDPGTYLNGLGVHRWASYHPAGRFWTFQAVEAGIFVGLATFLLALVIWRVKRRTF